MTPIQRRNIAVPLAIVLTLAAGSVMTGTTGTKFQMKYTTLIKLAAGFRNK